jgi:hypothetical protein
MSLRTIAFAAAALVLSTGIVVTLASNSVDARVRPHPIDIRAFMTGLACTESGGRFDAFNPKSGSFGKYQIMPRNWMAWAARYMGNRWAKTTPQNQEFIARERVLDLYEKHGSWRRAAHWWLTGNSTADETLWSARAAGYVDKVISRAEQAADPNLAAEVPARCFPLDVADPPIRTEPWPKAVISGLRVNVRVAPGAENRRVDTVRRGTPVAVLGKRSDADGRLWRRIGLKDGSSGWVARYFVRRE